MLPKQKSEDVGDLEPGVDCYRGVREEVEMKN